MGWNLDKFQLENVISTYMQRIFCRKNDPNLPDCEGKKNSKSPNFYNKFQQVAKNIEGFIQVFFPISYVARSG